MCDWSCVVNVCMLFVAGLLVGFMCGGGCCSIVDIVIYTLVRITFDSCPCMVYMVEYLVLL